MRFLIYGLQPVLDGFGHRGGGLGCGTYGPVGRGDRGMDGIGVGTAAIACAANEILRHRHRLVIILNISSLLKI